MSRAKGSWQRNPATWQNNEYGTAAELGDVQELERLIAENRERALEPVNDSGSTLFHCAVYTDRVEVIELLVRERLHLALIETPNNQGMSPLISAAEKAAKSSLGKLGMVPSLIEAGCDLNITNRGGNNALHYAGATKNTELFKYLLEKGVDPLVVNKQNFSAWGKYHSGKISRLESSTKEKEINAADSLPEICRKLEITNWEELLEHRNDSERTWENKSLYYCVLEYERRLKRRNTFRSENLEGRDAEVDALCVQLSTNCSTGE